MLLSAKLEYPSIWPNSAKRLQASAQLQHLRTMIWFFLSIEKQARSCGVALASNKWATNWLATLRISVKAAKCPFTMEPRIWTSWLYHHRCVLKYPRHPELVTTSGFVEMTELQSLTSVKVQPQRVISTLPWTLQRLWGVKLYSIAATICTPFQLQSMTNTLAMVLSWEVLRMECHRSELMATIFLRSIMQQKPLVSWS